MEVYQLAIYCVLFVATASFSLPDAIAENTNVILNLNSQSKSCDCKNGNCVTDKLGHTKCICKPGFALQSNFTCKPCDCGTLGKCIFILKLADSKKIQYQKKCVCDVGRAEKNGVCVDCFCGENSACDFNYGDRRCYCIEGYSEKDRVCTRCNCGFNGHCQYKDGNKNCECYKGYLELNGICEECDCGDHGTCSFENGQKSCKCQSGFSVNNGKCEPCDCGSNSDNCVFEHGVKQCKCKDRYADRYGTCEECYCGDYTSFCNFKDNQKTCSCLEGYVQKGERCEIGCSAKRLCQNGGYCKEGFCFCQKGTRGDFCEIIEECDFLCPNDKDISCAYDVGSQKAYCKCSNNNLKYNPALKQCSRTCKNDKSCKNQGKCTGTDLKFCDCLNGTTGEFCEEIPLCKGIDCGPNANCVFNPTTKKTGCACQNPNLFYDSSVGKCIRTCNSDTECLNGGKCVYKGSKKFCKCLAGTQGDRCEIINNCPQCRGEGAYCKFDAQKLNATCKCIDKKLEYDFSFKKCTWSCANDTNCLNGGTCDHRGEYKFCNCLKGTQDPRCQIVDDCFSGSIKCRGESAHCVYDVKKLKGVCKCADKNYIYNSKSGRCRHKHIHH